MRFVEDGPDIPNALIKKWRDGEVLFLAGAGVSVPSRLPLFEGLALRVYQHLSDPLFEVLQKWLEKETPKERATILESSTLTPECRVEADLFLDKHFDRFFSALEKRLDPDHTGRVKTRNVRNAVEEILGGKAPSDSHKNLLRLSVSQTLSGDPSKPSVCRIATTNFDTLFEEAWKTEVNDNPISFDARIAPRPGAHNFQGIIHLHGTLMLRPLDTNCGGNCIYLITSDIITYNGCSLRTSSESYSYAVVTKCH